MNGYLMNNIKEHAALVRVKEAVDLYGNMLFVGHSGGKDSCVIHHMTQRFMPEVTLVHNVKPMLSSVGGHIEELTAMYPSTLEFLYSNVALKNRMSFMPSHMMERFIRDSNLKCQIDGARIAEANRPGKSSNFIHNGINVNRQNLKPFIENGMFGLHVCYPIFDWSDDDVFDYVVKHEIQLSDEYFENGEVMTYLEKIKNGKR